MNTKDKFIFIILFSIIGFGFYFQHLNDENLKKMDSLKDDNKDFDNSNSHRSKFNLVTQTHTQGELNFTYSPFKQSITSGSFTSGNVFVRLIQETRITARIHDPLVRDSAIAITPLLNSQEGSQVDYLTVTQFFSDQFP